MGETRFEDYTGSTQDIINNVPNTTNIDCCSYKYQLLDKFCAGQSKVSDVHVHVHVSGVPKTRILSE